MQLLFVDFTGVSVSNILVPAQGMPISMPMSFGGSIAIPIHHQSALGPVTGGGQKGGIAATSVSVVTTLPRQMAHGSRMPGCLTADTTPLPPPIYYNNSPASYRGATATHHPYG